MPILWTPSTDLIKYSNMSIFICRVNKHYNLNISSYAELYQWSIDNLQDFWLSYWYFDGPLCNGEMPSESGIELKRAFIEGDHISNTTWFPDIKINFAENLLIGSIETKDAIIFANENGVQRKISHSELYTYTSYAINFLNKHGITEGDRVAGYLPNMPEAVIWMLATTAIGAIWSSTSPDFGEQGVIDRFGQISPKILITTDGYWYNQKKITITDKVINICNRLPSLEHLVVVDYIGCPNDLLKLDIAINHNIIINNAFNHIDQVIEFKQFPFDHPGFILYSSGTTGKPKTIVHRAGGVLITHFKEHSLHVDLCADDVLFYYTTTGWMMWNWLVSALASHCTIVLYDGSPLSPNKNILWQLTESLGITIFGTSAKYLATMEELKMSPKDNFDLSKLRTILSTGSILADHSFDYVYNSIKSDVQLSSISGGTDIVSCFALGNPLTEVRRGELQARGLGYAVEAYGIDGSSVVNGCEGELVCTKPFPSMPLGFWQDTDNEKFLKAYFSMYPNIWYHGDFIIIYDCGGVRFLGRSDTTLNPSGIRIGSGEIYQVVETIEGIEDSIVIGQNWHDDERIILFVQLESGVIFSDELENKIKSEIRIKRTPRHVPAKILPITDIPYTINGKKVEIAVKNIINGKAVTNVGVLRNPECLELYKNIRSLSES